MTPASLDELLKEWEFESLKHKSVNTRDYHMHNRILSLIAVVRKQREALFIVEAGRYQAMISEAGHCEKPSNEVKNLGELAHKYIIEAERILNADR